MRAADIAEDFPVITIDADALEAVRMIAEQRLPGILVVDASGGTFRGATGLAGGSIYRAPLCAG